MPTAKSKIFDYSFLSLGLAIQVAVYWLQPAATDQLAIISLISGLMGICSVCLTAQGNILTFLFGFGQVGTYTYLCITQRFYGEIMINAYYFITMIYGIFVWKKRLNSSDLIVEPKRLKASVFVWIAVATLLLSWLTGWALARWTDDTQPYLDAFTTVPALVAQVLMILVYREHWFIWLAVDVLATVMWLRAGNYSMAAQYIFWCLNCLYGLRRWSKLSASLSARFNSKSNRKL